MGPELGVISVVNFAATYDKVQLNSETGGYHDPPL
jgi:hypothetical protein